MLYFLCSAHRAAAMGSAGKSSASQGWNLAEELLGSALRDWGGKKDCDQWCQTALNAFATRVPQILLRLSWIEQIKLCRKAFAQRAQLTFVAEQLMRPPQPSNEGEATLATHASSGPSAAFADAFAELCADLLEATVAPGNGNAVDEAGGNASQRQKMKRDALRALKTTIRGRQKAEQKAERGERPEKGSPFGPAASAKVASAVQAVRDELSVWHGEVYHLCLHILRVVRPGKGKDSGTDDGRASGKKQKRPSVASGDEARRPQGETQAAAAAASPKLEPRMKKAAPEKNIAASIPQVQKGSKKFFEEL